MLIEAVRLVFVLAIVLITGLLAGPVRGQMPRHEVWVIDQADAARGGARLYIYDGTRLEETGQSSAPVVVNLHESAQGIGDGPGVRPHMVLFNSSFSHAVISNVASGHVYVMRTADRRIVASIDAGDQAHAAYPSPDGRVILVANQNGKRLARISADFTAERFAYSAGDDIDLRALEGAAQPDNAPICPILFAGRKAYVTLRGGGLIVADYISTPMRVLRSYGRDSVGPAGCGGIAANGKIYVNSGSATSSDLYVFDPQTDSLMKHLRLAWLGSDAHGMAVVGGGRFIWMANRADHNIAVINTATDSLAGIITGIGTAPDLMDVSPSGRRVYLTLRGPNNLTGGPTAKGETPGVAMLEVLDGGRSGRRLAFLPIGDQTAGSPNDPHGIAVRVTR